MPSTIVYTNLYTDYREAQLRSLLDSCLESLVTRWDVFCRNSTTLDFIYKYVVWSWFIWILADCRFDITCNTSILTGTTSLLLVCIVEVCSLTDSFSVSDFWLTYSYFSLVLSLHSLDVYIQVKLSHTLDDSLVRLWVYICLECRVFLCKSVESLGHVVCSLLVNRSDGKRDNRIWNEHTCHGVVERWITESITACTVDTKQSCNLTAACLRDIFHC